MWAIASVAAFAKCKYIHEVLPFSLFNFSKNFSLLIVFSTFSETTSATFYLTEEWFSVTLNLLVSVLIFFPALMKVSWQTSLPLKFLYIVFFFLVTSIILSHYSCTRYFSHLSIKTNNFCYFSCLWSFIVLGLHANVTTHPFFFLSCTHLFVWYVF